MRRAATALIAIILMLVALGLVMLYSTSSVRSSVPHFYLKRQAIWLCFGVIAGVCVAKIDYHHWRKLAIPMTLITFVMLALVFIPGIGATVKGSSRWISLGPVRIQPSELSKFVVIVGMSSWMSSFARQAGDVVVGFVYPFIGLCAIAGMIFLEPDFGTTAVVFFVGMAIMFVAGTQIRLLIGAGISGLTFLSIAVVLNPNRLGRIMSFLYPEKYVDQAYHLAQSKIAFIMGGPFGVGLGNSMQKHLYLPEAHTDFILSIIAEELGFVFVIFVVILFVGLFVCGMAISFKADDLFGRLLGFGVTMMISIQAAFNIGVVTGCLPTKGLALPFISYGGSSLVMAIVMSSVLLSIAQYSEEGDGKQPRSIKDRAHRF